MFDFLQNTWFIGITGSIASSVIVYTTSKLFSKKRYQKEYTKRVQDANKEILNILKPYVAELGLPTSQIIGIITASIAREYGIQKNEIHSEQIISEELIKGIFTNEYLPNPKKRDFVESITKNIFQSVQNTESTDDITNISMTHDTYLKKASNTTYFITLATTVSATIPLFLIIFESKQKYALIEKNPSLINILITILISCLVAACAVLVSFLVFKLRHLYAKNNDTKSNEKQ